MKRIWKTTTPLRKASRKDQGVSPVIATILMVAITVVLAAVLYVMVMGINPPNPDVTAGVWNETTATSETSGTIVFGPFADDMKPTNLKIFVKANDTMIGAITWGLDNDPSSVKWADGPDGATVLYQDYQPNGGQINSGDYLELDGLLPGTKYSFEALNYNSGNIISMSGDADFNTP